MPAGRDTRREAARVRRLSPLQTVEDQSQAWGICLHSCTWREGLAPSWKTELQSASLCDLPEDLSPLSINGSHLNEGRVDLPAMHREHLLDGTEGAEDDAGLHVDEAPAPHGLDHLRIEQLRQRHPARFRRRATSSAAWWLDPLAKVR